jgi:hypothetical protein
MAKIIVGVYMFRYPLGGMLSWALQYLRGLSALGHEVYAVEKAHYPQACYDPARNTMTDDPAAGLRIVGGLLDNSGLGERWCMTDYRGRCHGMSATQMNELFKQADIFIDCGSHGSWLEEAASLPCRVLIDGEPSYTQIRWEALIASGQNPPAYDHYFTNGLLFGTDTCDAPTLGHTWRPIPNPVDTAFYQPLPAPDFRKLSTVMNWSAHNKVNYKGRELGQKDAEFERFIGLPGKTDVRMELAVAGNVPTQTLQSHGWVVRDAHEVTRTIGSYREYIRESAGEFGVCKQVFVATRNGWFSDRSAAYLASGRPVILQDTGFSEVLPTGEGLFAVNHEDEAASAIESVFSDYDRHAAAARRIAVEYLDAERVMGGLLNDVGIGSI